MMRSEWKIVLFIACAFTVLVCCRKKTLSSAAGLPGNVDSVPVTPVTPGSPVYAQLPRHEEINANIGGFYEALPPSYDSNQNKYPLIVFLHGGGELGNGNDQLPLVLKNAIPSLLNEKIFPLSFTIGDSSYSFVIISPQFKAWPVPDDVKAVVDYAIDHYRINTHRLYMVGLSMGGGATWEYAGKEGRRLAAMIPISGASWADSATAKAIAATNVPTWAFHNKDDSSVTYKSTTRYISFIQYYNPSFPIKYTQWETGGHDAWTKATDPAYQEDGRNIYEWMLQYSR